MAEALTLDPVSEDAANSELVLTSGNYGLVAHQYPQPSLRPQWASSADTEGALLSAIEHENRQITLTVFCATVAALKTLETKLAKLYREGGTFKRVFNDGRTIVFDVLTVEGYDPPFAVEFDLASVTEAQFTLTCKPYGRGTEQDLGDNIETTLPALVFTEASVPGDVPGLGRLVIDEDQGVNQAWVTWGIQSRRYDASTSAALFYEAEGRTPLGSTATAAGTGASGAGSNVMRNSSVSTTYQSVLSTQATAGGAHLTHIGTFRVYARVQQTTSAGNVSIALEWSQGDFSKYTRNAVTTFETAWAGSWRLIDLGMVTLTKVRKGAQRWEGRIIAKSTVLGDSIDIDYLMMVPVDEGSGEAYALPASSTPASFSARDEFDQAAGALAGKTLPVGGTWSGAGDVDDFVVEATGHTVQRTAVSDSSISNGRFAIAGVTALTDTVAQVDYQVTSVGTTGAGNRLHGGLLLRYIDTANWMKVVYDVDYATSTPAVVIAVIRSLAGVVSTRGSVSRPLVNATWYTLLATVNSAGLLNVFWGPQNAVGSSFIVRVSDTALATGGTLASGKVGIYDAYTAATGGGTRSFDNFLAYAPSGDAAIFASQSIEVRYDGVVREDLSGLYWQPPSVYEGDYLLVPPAGLEARTARVIVKASRGKPGEAVDAAIDDLSARLFVTPRYLAVPS